MHYCSCWDLSRLVTKEHKNALLVPSAGNLSIKDKLPAQRATNGGSVFMLWRRYWPSGNNELSEDTIQFHSAVARHAYGQQPTGNHTEIGWNYNCRHWGLRRANFGDIIIPLCNKWPLLFSPLKDAHSCSLHHVYLAVLLIKCKHVSRMHIFPLTQMLLFRKKVGHLISFP